MDKISTLLSRGVDTVYPSLEALEKVLRGGKKLTLYQGFDPTGAQLHIGHMVGFRKLRQFQDLGHHVIFLIGDGTGLAGDPSGKMKTRGRFMSREELRANAVSYLKQAGKIVRFEGDNPIEIRYNGDWLTALKLEDILNIAQNFSLQQMIERDMYQERMKAGDSINLREFMYPLLQGYDSVAMGVDLEIGGTDQTFNMLAGRTLVKAMLGNEKFVLTVPLLTDSKGIKIGKTEGNVIGLTDPPEDFFGKIMSLSDSAILPCYRLLTDVRDTVLADMETAIQNGSNPMEFKKNLAFELTKSLNNEQAATEARNNFESLYQKRDLTGAVMKTLSVRAADTVTLADLVVATNMTRSEAKRLIVQGAVRINDIPYKIASDKPEIGPGDVLKIGKTGFYRIEISQE